MHLYGLVPFEQLLGSTLDELAPQFMARLASLESCTALPTDEAAIAATYSEAAAEAGPSGSFSGFSSNRERIGV